MARRLLLWNHIQAATTHAFDRMPHRESALRWAKMTWDTVTMNGWGTYQTEEERTRLCTRALALLQLYADWCNVAWQDDYPLDLAGCADHLGLQASCVGQLSSANANAGPDASAILRDLVARERRLLVERLNQMFTRPLLFGTLALSRSFPASEEEIVISPSELEELIAAFPEGYEWVQMECPGRAESQSSETQ